MAWSQKESFGGNLSDSDDDFDSKKRKNHELPTQQPSIKRPKIEPTSYIKAEPTSYTTTPHSTKTYSNSYAEKPAVSYASAFSDVFGDEDNVKKKFENEQSSSTAFKESYSKIPAVNFQSKSSFGDKMMVNIYE